MFQFLFFVSGAIPGLVLASTYPEAIGAVGVDANLFMAIFVLCPGFVVWVAATSNRSKNVLRLLIAFAAAFITLILAVYIRQSFELVSTDWVKNGLIRILAVTNLIGMQPFIITVADNLAKGLKFVADIMRAINGKEDKDE